MTEREFDQMLKRALAEARNMDQENSLEDEIPMSPRQRARMERMRRDPAGYYRRYTRETAVASEKERSELPEPSRPAHRHRKRVLRYGTAAVIAALLGGTALAYSLTGGQFFRQLFLREAESAVSAYMDADQLLELGGGNVGAVQETEALRLELLDAVSSGNAALVAIRITAKQLTGFPQNGETYHYYGFLEIWDAFSESSGAFSSSARYLFREDDPTLAENECILLLSYTSREPISDGAYFIELRDFGSLDTEEVLVPGQWKLSVELGGQDPHSRVVEPKEEYLSGDCVYMLDSVAVTPLSLTLEFSCESDALDCDELLWELVNNMSIHLSDGIVLDCGQFYQGRTAAGADGHWSMTVGVEFGVPLPAETIQFLELGGKTVGLGLQ